MKNEELSPRQILFLKGYLDPKSETFSNALQSALKAGFTQEYAENITNLMPNWLSEAIGSGPIVEKAEKLVNIYQDHIVANVEQSEKRKYEAMINNVINMSFKYLLLSKINLV